MSFLVGKARSCTLNGHVLQHGVVYCLDDLLVIVTCYFGDLHNQSPNSPIVLILAIALFIALVMRTCLAVACSSASSSASSSPSSSSFAQTYMTKSSARACVGVRCPPCHLKYPASLPCSLALTCCHFQKGTFAGPCGNFQGSGQCALRTS